MNAPEQSRIAGKRADAARAASQHQREWFQQVHRRVADGEPFAVLSVGLGEELMLAMGVPYMVQQWWASVLASRQQSSRLFQLLVDRGYGRVSSYGALAFASAIDDQPELQPWGGIPEQAMLVGPREKYAHAWSEAKGIPLLDLDRTIQIQVDDPRWWEIGIDDWEQLYEKLRLDRMVADLQNIIDHLEQVTGRSFDHEEFARVMLRANQTQANFREARDLLVSAPSAVMSLADMNTSVLIPQWHRGTEWALQASADFLAEARDAVERAEPLADPERIRIMWLGTGLWYGTAFYERFQEEFGAVFVWSLYLSLAADGYERRGPAELRTLAARFLGLGENVTQPPWNVEWFLQQTRTHRIDAVIDFGRRVRGTGFIHDDLAAAGIPVLNLDAHTVDDRGWDEEEAYRTIAEFLTNEVLKKK